MTQNLNNNSRAATPAESDLKLPELGKSQKDLIRARLEQEERSLKNYRHLFDNLARQVFELHRANPFSSIVSDEASGRFVSVFIRHVLRESTALPVVCADPNSDLSQHLAGDQVRKRLGNNPLITTEAIYSGTACCHIVASLKQMNLAPSVAALFVTEARGVNSCATIRRILQAGAANVIKGGTLSTFEQGVFFRNPALTGLVSIKDKSAGTKVLKPWYKTEEDTEFLPQSKQIVLNSARSLLREIAEEFKQAQT